MAAAAARTSSAGACKYGRLAYRPAPHNPSGMLTGEVQFGKGPQDSVSRVHLITCLRRAACPWGPGHPSKPLFPRPAPVDKRLFGATGAVGGNNSPLWANLEVHPSAQGGPAAVGACRAAHPVLCTASTEGRDGDVAFCGPARLRRRLRQGPLAGPEAGLGRGRRTQVGPGQGTTAGTSACVGGAATGGRAGRQPCTRAGGTYCQVYTPCSHPWWHAFSRAACLPLPAGGCPSGAAR